MGRLDWAVEAMQIMEATKEMVRVVVALRMIFSCLRDKKEEILSKNECTPAKDSFVSGLPRIAAFRQANALIS
jgi:helix-turn-helix protein